jgi:hypothetical protein
MSSLLTAPTLQYVGSCDTSTTNNGSVMFKILFDASINILMFEYLVKTNSTNTAPVNIVSTGFIHTDTCTPCGISNQYLIPIPADQNGTTSNYVQVRVYDSTTGQASEWSLPLVMHYPPAEPTILSSYFDKFTDYGYYDDILYVLFEAIETSNVIVAYYYTNQYTQQVTWQVTPPTPLINFTSGSTTGSYITLPLGNDVDLGSPIYVAAHAFYSWSDADGTYSAVSEVTPTVAAQNALYAPPVLDTLNYLVYTDLTRPQTMQLTWTAPVPSGSPFQLFVVDYYNLYVYENNVLVDTINVGNVTTYDADVSAYGCGTEMSFKVSAVSVTGVETNLSNALNKNIFIYPSQPLNLNVGYLFNANASASLIDVIYEFSNPIALGCGAHINFKCVISALDANQNATVVSTDYVPYVAGSAPYVESKNDLVVPLGSQTFVIAVSLGNTDTNGGGTLYGEKNTIIRSILNTPVITNIDLYGSTLSFTVTSPSLLDLVNNIALISGIGDATILDWSSSLTGPNVVSFTTDGLDQQVYNISVDLGSYVANKVIVNASNQTGIGYGLANL